MSDEDGAFVAKIVYKRLFSGDSPTLDPNDVPYTLDEAVQEMRRRGLPIERWVPFIHLGI